MIRNNEDAFWDRVSNKHNINECWIWMNKLHPSGYGRFGYKGI